MKTLVEAKTEFDVGLKEGTTCPVCDRYAKLHKRPLNKTMVKALCWIVQNTRPGEYINVASEAPAWLLRSNQHTTLKHWDLLEQGTNTNPKTKNSGLWRATAKGRAFANNQEPTYKYAVLYNDKCYVWGGPEVYAEDIVDTFDYSEL